MRTRDSSEWYARNVELGVNECKLCWFPYKKKSVLVPVYYIYSLHILSYVKHFAALPCETVVFIAFRKSHKFRNTILVFMNLILLNSSNNLSFLFKMCVKEVPEYAEYSMEVGIKCSKCMINFVTSSVIEFAVAA